MEPTLTFSGREPVLTVDAGVAGFDAASSSLATRIFDVIVAEFTQPQQRGGAEQKQMVVAPRQGYLPLFKPITRCGLRRAHKFFALTLRNVENPRQEVGHSRRVPTDLFKTQWL